jgi:VIT1/CCC1 family predicted Fe2+/Mn2+ transporter
MLLELRGLSAEDAFRKRVAAELPPLVAQAMNADSYSYIRQAVQTYARARPAYWSRQEIAAAGLICALVFASTFPLVLPFMVMQEPQLALRASHAIAIAMLFVLGWKLGRWSGASPLGSGTLLAMGGVVLAVLCVALGG